MIDSLELKFPSGMKLRNRWNVLSTEGIGVPGVINHAHYTIELHRYGMSAAFHVGRRGRFEYRKVAFTRTSTLAYSQMRAILDDLTDDNSSSLVVARIDFAVDVSGIPVSWFRDHATVPRKHFSREFGSCRGQNFITETLYYGKRPNCYRIYDKIAEQRVRGARSGAPSDRGGILTRVERQYAGARIPKPIRRFGDLPNVLDLNFFSDIRIVPSNNEPPPCSDMTVIQRLAHLGFNALAINRGLHEATRFLNKYSRGNAARIRRSLGFEERSPLPELPDLDALCRESTRRQLWPEAANRNVDSSDPKTKETHENV